MHFAAALRTRIRLYAVCKNKSIHKACAKELHDLWWRTKQGWFSYFIVSCIWQQQVNKQWKSRQPHECTHTYGFKHDISEICRFWYTIYECPTLVDPVWATLQHKLHAGPCLWCFEGQALAIQCPVACLQEHIEVDWLIFYIFEEVK